MYNQDTLEKRIYDYPDIQKAIQDARKACQRRGIGVSHINRQSQGMTPVQVLQALGLQMGVTITMWEDS